MKQLTTITLTGIAYFVVVIIALHFLRPDINPISRPTSEYAVGHYGFLMNTAFLSMSIATFSLLIGLHKRLTQPARSRIGLILLGVWGVGVLIAMSFPINPEGTELTGTSTIHRVNGPLIFLSLTVSTILISSKFQLDKNWKTLYYPARALSLAMLVIFITTGVNVAIKSGFEGLCQRIFLLVLVSWFIVTTMHLRALNSNLE